MIPHEQLPHAKRTPGLFVDQFQRQAMNRGGARPEVADEYFAAREPMLEGPTSNTFERTRREGTMDRTSIDTGQAQPVFHDAPVLRRKATALVLATETARVAAKQPSPWRSDERQPPNYFEAWP